MTEQEFRAKMVGQYQDHLRRTAEVAADVDRTAKRLFVWLLMPAVLVAMLVLCAAVARGGESDTLPRAPCEVRPAAPAPPFGGPPTAVLSAYDDGRDLTPEDKAINEATAARARAAGIPNPFAGRPATSPPPPPTALPRGAGTGIPPLDDLLREAKRRNMAVARKFNEDGRGVQWFQATPDGWLTRIPDPTPAPRPGVAAGPTFRPAKNAPGLYECEFNPDHVCKRCGAVQLVIDHWNRDGTHTHRCGVCGHTWRH